jgi:hypothetical protein
MKSLLSLHQGETWAKHKLFIIDADYYKINEFAVTLMKRRRLLYLVSGTCKQDLSRYYESLK